MFGPLMKDMIINNMNDCFTITEYFNKSSSFNRYLIYIISHRPEHMAFCTWSRDN